MRVLRATEKLEKCRCFFTVHDPQHPTLHLNLYILQSFAALISTSSAFRLLLVFVAKRQSPSSAERATCCLPLRSAFKHPHQHLHIRGPRDHFHPKLVADFGLPNLSSELSCLHKTGVSQPLPPYVPGAKLRRITTRSFQTAAIWPLITSLHPY